MKKKTRSINAKILNLIVKEDVNYKEYLHEFERNYTAKLVKDVVRSDDECAGTKKNQREENSEDIGFLKIDVRLIALFIFYVFSNYFSFFYKDHF